MGERPVWGTPAAPEARRRGRHGLRKGEVAPVSATRRRRRPVDTRPDRQAEVRDVAARGPLLVAGSGPWPRAVVWRAGLVASWLVIPVVALQERFPLPRRFILDLRWIWAACLVVPVVIVVADLLRTRWRLPDVSSREPPFVVWGRSRLLAAALGPAPGALCFLIVVIPEKSTIEDWALSVLFFGWMAAVLVGWACLLLWRQRIEVRPEGLVVVQRWARVQIPWHRVTGITWQTENPDAADHYSRLLIWTDRGRVASRVPTTRDTERGPVAKLRERLLALADAAAPNDEPIRVSGPGHRSAGLC